MRTTILFVALALVFSACSDDGSVIPIMDGTYIGTFTITFDGGQTQTGNVTFTFNGSSYSCVPQHRYLPPNGAGSFQTMGKVIKLKDTSMHTAEFDWTLILNGDFSFTFDGSRLVLQQNDTQHHRVRTINLTRQ